MSMTYGAAAASFLLKGFDEESSLDLLHLGIDGGSVAGICHLKMLSVFIFLIFESLKHKD